MHYPRSLWGCTHCLIFDPNRTWHAFIAFNIRSNPMIYVILPIARNAMTCCFEIPATGWEKTASRPVRVRARALSRILVAPASVSYRYKHGVPSSGQTTFKLSMLISSLLFRPDAAHFVARTRPPLPFAPPFLRCRDGGAGGYIDERVKCFVYASQKFRSRTDAFRVCSVAGAPPPRRGGGRCSA